MKAIKLEYLVKGYRQSSIDSFGWWDVWEFCFVESSHPDWPVVQLDLSGLEVKNGGVGVFHEVHVVSLLVVISGMSSSGLLSGDSRV